jgi:hypothetical protein
MSTITVTNLTDASAAGETDLRQAVAEAGSGDRIHELDDIVLPKAEACASMSDDETRPRKVFAGASEVCGPRIFPHWLRRSGDRNFLFESSVTY